MKLKTKAKILLGALITSILISHAGVFSPVHAVCKPSFCKRRSERVPMCRQETAAKRKRRLASELYLAVQRNDCNHIKELYHMGANINTREYHPIGYTPLHHAVLLNRLEVVKCLIEECGADATLSSKEKYGLTPYDVAIEKDRFDIALYFAGLKIREQINAKK